jgi:hypothetical protein
MQKTTQAAAIFSLGWILIAFPPLVSGGEHLPPADQRASPVRTTDTLRTFPRVASLAEWQRRAHDLRVHALVCCGLWPLPEKTPLQTHLFGKLERDGYSVEKVYFQTIPGFYLAGNLYRPRG